MIEAIGLIACAAIGGLCFSAGTLVGAKRQRPEGCIHCADTKAELLRCNEVLEEATKAIDLYHELFQHAKPILQEHTWHSMRVEK
jgi:predicted RNase H-like HicB family nuclease